MILRNKKGQMEMIGLVMVIILLVFGLMIYVRIQLNNSETDSEGLEGGYMADLASKTLKVMLHTTSNCLYLNGRQLISDVASNYDFNSNSIHENNLVVCDGKSSYEILDETDGFIDKILLSLQEEGFHYTFKVGLKGKDFFITKQDEGGCEKSDNTYQGEYVFDSDKGKVIAILILC